MQHNSSAKYDYIFLGAGCASLSLLMRMINSGKFNHKKILLVDKQKKNSNDRTWCFWEKHNGYFDSLVCKKWNALQFKNQALSIDLDMPPYQYKMIRGIDFYEHCFSVINDQSNITIEYGEISFDAKKIKINNDLLQTCDAVIFNSIYIPSAKQSTGTFYLLQHFKGCVIETNEDKFDDTKGTLMDFSMSQHEGTTFVYVLPLSRRKALVEYTLFTKKLLPKDVYDLQVKNYLEQNLNIKNYKVAEEEFGVIPMTNQHFSVYENGMYNIGTAGGQTKASSGYTFNFIQKQADQWLQHLIADGHPPKKNLSKLRFHFYDSTLLHILAKDIFAGSDIFSTLFQRNKASQVFKFLDNETSISEELKIINSLPKKPFLKAGVSELAKIIFA